MLIPPFSLQTSNFCSPQNWEEWEGMGLGLMKFLLKPLNTPSISTILFSIKRKKKKHSYTLLPICYKVKLLLFRETPLKLLLFINIVTRYSLTAASFGYCSQVSLSFSYVSTGSVMFASYFMSCHIFSIFVS